MARFGKRKLKRCFAEKDDHKRDTKVLLKTVVFLFSNALQKTKMQLLLRLIHGLRIMQDVQKKLKQTELY